MPGDFLCQASSLWHKLRLLLLQMLLYHGTFMELVRMRKMGTWCVALRQRIGAMLVLAVLILFGSAASALAQTNLSADEVIQKAIAQARQGDARPGQKDFTYTKVSVTEELDAQGKVKERKEKVYRI